MKTGMRLLLLLVIVFQSNSGLAGKHRKIEYTVDFENSCKNTIRDLQILYDGEDFFFYNEKINLAYLGGGSYGMPLTIPDLAVITWKDSKGHPYEAKVPIRSLLHLSDYFFHRFSMEYKFCDGQLRVFFTKEDSSFEDMTKEIWNNLKDKKLRGKNFNKYMPIEY